MPKIKETELSPKTAIGSSAFWHKDKHWLHQKCTKPKITKNKHKMSPLKNPRNCYCFEMVC